MYAVIDVGSNSVRLMLHDGKSTIEKFVKTTKLADGLARGNELSPEAMTRTADAVVAFAYKAREKTDEIMVFATEAVRRASNGNLLLEKVYQSTGLEIHVVSGELEARLGYVGVGVGGQCTVVDIGGASTEVVFGNDGVIDYAQSVAMGGVVLRDMCGETEKELKKHISGKIKEFGKLPKCKDVIAIGGTATTISALIYEIQPYNPSKVHQSVIKKADLSKLIKKVKKLSLEERMSLKGMFIGREDIIVGAMHVLYYVMKMLKVDSVTVSESDNLEGYLMLKLAGEL